MKHKYYFIQIVRQLIEFILELVYPGRCPVCDEPVKQFGTLICPGCRGKMQYIKAPRCFRCGKSLKQEDKEYCHDCSRLSHGFDQGRALFTYRSVADSIFRFKYMNRREYSRYFGTEIADKLGDVIKKWEPDALVPVPLHPSRKRKRGYNQAELLADVIGSKMSIPVQKGWIVRTRRTTPQKELSALERQNNLKRAFKIRLHDVKLNTIIIIDDIYTTGSTVDAMSAVMRENGVQRIYFITLAMGTGI
ncbi:MAG: ComF family protein [Lachnospiraceae bacterium]|nr:ComF family protein [Lachnospiraceae bacterium]